jgi:hypothetical protein
MIRSRQAGEMVNSLVPEMKPSLVHRANTQAHNSLKAFALSPGLVW